MSYQWIASFSEKDLYGFRKIHIKSIDGESFSTDAAWELDVTKLGVDISLSEDEIKMYDELGRYLVETTYLGVFFHVWVCGCPVQYPELIPCYDWAKSCYDQNLGFYYWLNFDHAIATIEKYKGYQLSVEIAEGSFTRTNENQLKIQQVLETWETCKGNKSEVVYQSINFDSYLQRLSS
jgi:hypothetical protein